MEEIYELTRSDIFNIFKKWNDDILKNPEGYQKLTDTNIIKHSESQADKFLDILYQNNISC